MLQSSSVKRLIEEIHLSPARLSVNICGAGVSALAALTEVPGCSRTLLEGNVLYSTASTVAALDYTPRGFVNRVCARHLSQHAFHRSVALCSDNDLSSVASQLPTANATEPFPSVLGVGATSAVQTSRVRKGSDQAFVSVWGTARAITTTAAAAIASPSGEGSTALLDAHLALPSDMTRQEQDEQVALLILHAVQAFLSTHAGIAQEASIAPLLCQEPTIEWHTLPSHRSEGEAHVVTALEEEAAVAIHAVMDGRSPLALFNHHGEARASVAPLLYPEEEEAVPPLRKTEASSGASDRAAAASGSREGGVSPIRLLYPGSFRPLHWGHTELARAALAVCRERFHAASTPHDTEASLGKTPSSRATEDHVTYEIAAKIVDKGAVSAADLQQRIRQFTQRGERVAVTGAMLFVEKATLFPGRGFIVGVDTAKRILDPKYYPGGDEAGMVRALRTDIADRGCYFVVGGRAVATEGNVTTWEDMTTLEVPEALKDLFISVPESRFRVDISSTELRARQAHFQGAAGASGVSQARVF